MIRGERLVIKVDEDATFVSVQACSNEITLPKGLSKLELFQQLRIAAVHGSRGFGGEDGEDEARVIT